MPPQDSATAQGSDDLIEIPASQEAMWHRTWFWIVLGALVLLVGGANFVVYQRYSYVGYEPPVLQQNEVNKSNSAPNQDIPGLSVPATTVRTNAETPMVTYTYLGHAPGERAPVLEVTEPAFGEGVFIDPRGQLLPANFEGYTRGFTAEQSKILRMTYINTDAWDHFFATPFIDGTVYIGCGGIDPAPAGDRIVLGKSLWNQCNPGEIGIITESGEGISIGSMYAG